MADAEAKNKGKTSTCYEPVTEFGKRNTYLAAIVPDALENAVDALLPDSLERVLDKGCENVYTKYQNFRTDLQEGVGEVAGVLFRVAKHAYERFHIGDLVFGVYQLALHHSTVDALDGVAGCAVADPALITFLIECTDAATAAYCPQREELVQTAGIADADLLVFEPQTNTTRPAFAIWDDAAKKQLVWAFRGTTDLNDMLTDACASCASYAGGYAHWGMLEAASWFVENELPRVVALLKERPGYSLLLVGHSLGAGTAAMLAHMLKNDPKASAMVAGIKFQAVGVATPAVLTEELAEGCSDYITSVVLMHDIVPRFSISNVFDMKEELDATRWGDILAATAKDWAVPDVIENSETYKRLARSASKQMVNASAVAARSWLGVNSWFVSTLHSWGLVKPNPARQHAQDAATVRDAAATSIEAAKAAVTDASVVADAVQGVQAQMANIAREDVHQVFAPGRLFFIKRLDKYKGRARYGNMHHRCALCDDDSKLPPHDTSAHEAAARCQDFYPGAQFELLEAGPKQRFRRIVLRETCLLDHLCGGYVQGLRFALDKAAAKAAAK